MPLPRLVAVVDIGKTNAKVVLIDSETRHQVAVRSTPNTVRRDGIYPHADTERLWQFILSALREMGAEHGVDGISITTHGATAALLAGDELAMPVLDYEFAGPDSLKDAYAAVRPPFSESLSPPLPGGLNIGAQIFWQSRAFAERFVQVTQILTYPQYWAWRLTGVMASERTSLGCHSDLWAPEQGEFSSLVNEQGWRPLFPEVKPAASLLGTITKAVAGETGLSAYTPVTCGIHDSNASLLPHLGGEETPFTILSTGTWVIAMTVGGATTHLDPARDSLANVDAFGRPVPTARFMGGREFDMLVPQPVEPSEADVARVIGADIQALPTFAAGVGPYPHSAGRWTLDPETLSAGERTAVVSLYLALMTQTCLRLSGIGRRIIIEGPLSRNKVFSGALAALTGVEVRVSGDATGTSLGASLLFAPDAAGAKPASSVVDGLPTPALADYAGRWEERVAAQ